MLTSGVKRVDTGVYDAIQQAQAGKFKGGSDLVFDLKNHGMGIGKINSGRPGRVDQAHEQLPREDRRRNAQGPDRARVVIEAPTYGRAGLVPALSIFMAY